MELSVAQFAAAEIASTSSNFLTSLAPCRAYIIPCYSLPLAKLSNKGTMILFLCPGASQEGLSIAILSTTS